jgi:hypothetical protein
VSSEFHWRVDLDGYPSITTDELTLDEVELVEKVAGVPWVAINPTNSLRCAKALFVVMAVRAGVAEDEAIKSVSSMTLKKIKRSFTFVQGDAQPVTETDVDADPPSSAPTSATG